jgi:hypothetical protein
VALQYDLRRHAVHALAALPSGRAHSAECLVRLGAGEALILCKHFDLRQFRAQPFDEAADPSRLGPL